MLDCASSWRRAISRRTTRRATHEPSFDGSKVTIIPEVKEALTAFAKADLISMGMDHHLGGAQLPATVAQAGFAWFSAANVSTTGYLMLTMANANLLAKFGTPEQIDAFVKPMLAGGSPGRCACPNQAGSSLADIVMRAEPRDDGTYRLFGSKMWISGASTSSPTTSCTWYWPRFRADRREPRASRCSSCPSSSSAGTETSAAQ